MKDPMDRDLVLSSSPKRTDWDTLVEKSVGRFPLRPDLTAPSRRKKEAIYDPHREDAADLADSRETLGFPGLPPFTRGVQPTMYRGRLWTMRQYSGFGSTRQTNERFHYLLSKGQTGLSMAFDLPTQMGYDSDHDLARGEVGRAGVPISRFEDMAQAFEGIELDRVSVSMTINATGIILLACYIAVARRQGIGLDRLSGTLQNDVLKEYVSRGTYIYPVEASLRITTDIFEFCTREMPRYNFISISGYHIREAGSTAAQELAFTFANAIAYIEAARQRGLEIADFANRLSFFFNAHSDFLEEIAKFRAARRIWYRILTDRFHVIDEGCKKLRFHTQTGGSTLTAQDPSNNIVRVALQALSAVLGGTQSLHTNALDEALALPTEESARIALRTQQIIAHETGVTETIDPFAGSFCMEALTSEIETEVFETLSRIDELGGTLRAVDSGYIQRAIQDSAYAFQKDLEASRRVIVGVNAFKPERPADIPVQSIDPTLEPGIIKELKAFRLSRDPAVVQSRLDRVREAASGDVNLVWPVVEAVESGATLGEISDALREVFGEYVDEAGV